MEPLKIYEVVELAKKLGASKKERSMVDDVLRYGYVETDEEKEERGIRLCKRIGAIMGKNFGITETDIHKLIIKKKKKKPGTEIKGVVIPFPLVGPQGGSQ